MGVQNDREHVVEKLATLPARAVVIKRIGGCGQPYLQWREDDRGYSGQGHRRNMLNTKYKTVGFGHATLNGYHYWVQEFGY